MNKIFSGKRKIDGHVFHDTGYRGAAAKVKQEYYQRNGARTRIIRIKNPLYPHYENKKIETVLLIGGLRSRRKK